MSEPNAHLSLVTLGVSNVQRSIAFYETLGFQRKGMTFDGIGFFQAGACAIAVWHVGDFPRVHARLELLLEIGR